MSSRARWVNAVLALALVGAVAGAYVAVGSSGATAASTARTARVSQGTVTATVSGTGNTASTTVVDVTPQTSGTLTSVRVRVGSKVAKNQVLATIDDSQATSALKKAKADLGSAQAQYDEVAAGQTATARAKDQLAVDAAELSLKNARSALSKAKGDAKDQAEQQVASAELQVAQAQATAADDAAKPTAAELAQASASLEAAQSAVDAARDTVAATVVRAPHAGTVLTVNGSVGENVSSSSGSSGGSTSASTGTGSTSSSAFVTIADLSSMEVTANVAEADAVGVKAGQAAVVTLSATGDSAPGKVTAVSLEGTTTNNVVQYPVTVTLDSVPSGVKLGASASVVITTGSKADVLNVPTSAVTTLGTRSSVTVVKNGVQQTVPVTTGLEGSSTTEISGAGVAVGDEVLLTSTGTTGTSTGVPGGGVRRSGVGGLGGVGGGRP